MLKLRAGGGGEALVGAACGAIGCWLVGTGPETTRRSIVSDWKMVRCCIKEVFGFNKGGD